MCSFRKAVRIVLFVVPMVIGIALPAALSYSRFALAESGAVTTNPRTRDPLKVGCLYGLTGPLMEISAAYRNGALLAAERSNEDYQMPLELVVEDHRWDSKLALSAYKKLSNIDEVRIFHLIGSSPTIALKPLTEANEHMLYTASAYLPDLENSRGLIRHWNRSDEDARSLADYIRGQGWKTVGAIVIENEWSNYFDTEFEKALTEREVRYIREYHAPDTSDFRSLSTRLIRQRPDAVVLISFGLPSGLAMKTLRDLRYSGPIIGNNGFAVSNDARRLVAEAGLKGIYVQDYPTPPPEFDKLYRDRFGEPAHAAAFWSYLDLELIAAAAKAVGPDPMAMVRHVKQLGSFEGRYGTLKISPDGDIVERTEIVEFDK